jgi:hypothetical protein
MSNNGILRHQTLMCRPKLIGIDVSDFLGDSDTVMINANDDSSVTSSLQLPLAFTTNTPLLPIRIRPQCTTTTLTSVMTAVPASEKHHQPIPRTESIPAQRTPSYLFHENL